MNKTLSVYDKFFLLGVGLILISKMAIFKDTNIITIISYGILLGLIVILFLNPNKSKNINISFISSPYIKTLLKILFIIFNIIYNNTKEYIKKEYHYDTLFLIIH